MMTKAVSDAAENDTHCGLTSFDDFKREEEGTNNGRYERFYDIVEAFE